MSFMPPGPSGLLNKVTLSCLESVHAVAPLTLWGWLPCWCDSRQSQAGISPSNPRTSMIQLRPWYHILPSANKTPVLLGESTALNTEAWIRASVFMTYSMESVLCEEGSPPTSFIPDLFFFIRRSIYLTFRFKPCKKPSNRFTEFDTSLAEYVCSFAWIKGQYVFINYSWESFLNVHNVQKHTQFPLVLSTSFKYK